MECLWRVTAGDSHLTHLIMTDCFTAVIMIHKEGTDLWSAAPCVAVLQTCSVRQLIYINILSAVSPLLLLRLLSLYQLPTHACTPSPSFLPRLHDHYWRQEGRRGKTLSRDPPPNAQLIWVAILAALLWLPFHAIWYKLGPNSKM